MLFTDHRTHAIDNRANQLNMEAGMMRPKRWPGFLLPSDLRQDVRLEYHRTSQSQSPQLETLPRFSGLLKGFRLGELTIFTGPTGSGKTTVLSQISLDLCAQKVGILWGSFEVRNPRLIQTMLHQIATEPIEMVEDTGASVLEPNRVDTSLPGIFDQAYERLSAMPMHFMNVFGSTPLEMVLEHMEEAVVQQRAQVVILDNLQFMLSGQGSNNFDKFDLVDQAIAAVRAFCNRHPVHVILVVHPRKELDESPLGLCSVSGTAKATQEADNVMILQRLDSNHRFLDLKKNRFDGELGRVRIGFSRRSRMIYEMRDDQKQE